MSEGEQRLVDTTGDYLYAVRDGEPVPDPAWRSCRLVLTDRRLVLATGDGKQAIPHARSRLLGPDEHDIVPDGVAADDVAALEVGENVVLVDAEVEDLGTDYCRAVLNDEVILAQSPAVVGGVVQDTDWSKARFRLSEGRARLGYPGGETTAFDVGDVGTVGTEERSVLGDRRTVVAVEHTDDEGRSVETHLSGTERHARALAVLFRRAVESRGGAEDLSEAESEVLMALYSGVSPFEMAGFVGMDVEEVEEIYDRLLAAGVVDKVRERTEVSLNAQGRNRASKEMAER